MESNNCKSKLCNGKVIGLLSVLLTVIIVVVVLAIVGVFDGSSSDNDSKNSGESSNVNDDDVSDVITMDMSNGSNVTNITAGDSTSTDDSVGYTKKTYKYSGMTFTDGRYCPNISMNSEVANDSLAHLADIGANWVAIVVTWYQEDCSSTTIFPQYEPVTCSVTEAHLTPGYCKTVNDSDLIATINTARNVHNLSVFLKPHIDPLRDCDWRGSISMNSDSDWDEWFESYTEFILHYAEIANDLEVEMLSVETELQDANTEAQDARWRNVTTKVRASYPHGLLTASANGAGGECNTMKWWNATEIDIIGCDEYSISQTVTSNDVDHLINLWETDVISEWYQPLYDTYEKPIIFTEIGFCSGKGPANLVGSCYTDADNETLYEQRAQYEAVLKVMNGSNYDWFEGFFWWNWATDAAFGGDDNSCMDPKFKPVEGLLREWYDAPNKTIPDEPEYLPTCECWL